MKLIFLELSMFIDLKIKYSYIFAKVKRLEKKYYVTVNFFAFKIYIIEEMLNEKESLS